MEPESFDFRPHQFSPSKPEDWVVICSPPNVQISWDSASRETKSPDSKAAVKPVSVQCSDSIEELSLEIVAPSKDEIVPSACPNNTRFPPYPPQVTGDSVAKSW